MISLKHVDVAAAAMTVAVVIAAAVVTFHSAWLFFACKPPRTA